MVWQGQFVEEVAVGELVFQAENLCQQPGVVVVASDDGVGDAEAVKLRFHPAVNLLVGGVEGQVAGEDEEVGGKKTWPHRGYPKSSAARPRHR